MAHADYDCCAICDDKLSYGGERTKEIICGECVAAMAREGVICGNVDELCAWIEKSTTDQVLSLMNKVGFSKCYYPNPVDKLFGAKADQGGKK